MDSRALSVAGKKPMAKQLLRIILIHCFYLNFMRFILDILMGAMYWKVTQQDSSQNSLKKQLDTLLGRMLTGESWQLGSGFLRYRGCSAG